ncbi:sarcosine oxidase subunit delta [Cochlodiniinecator piscidefendens]|uniref:sarcosine oxidase subunit delta n=1 Tax=Cochlodiniinecator piscidefendens TaxID=2715756 RepID=UPI001408C660|nr:sarcosine oxidase subunit delta [Cochlodiniinecator piscidefendens]
MLLIPCPHCGLRDEGEFTYGGPARTLPALDQDTQVWRDAFFAGQKPPGPMTELWYHTSGCESWIEVTRDTATHDILNSNTPQSKVDTP